ncbi:MAG TPA: phosphoribosylanthranilate isomerase [Asticcacaulis sp.]|nr:phosphoribosylanthranilate isomerase [Asticcacaulis sp.]
MTVAAKICGLSTLETARAARDGGAAYLGFMHFERSPRHLSLADMAALMRAIRAEPGAPSLVSVLVDPDDGLLTAVRDEVKPDLIQLHGKESPDRVRDIRAHFGMPVIKVLSISEAADLARADEYVPHADYLMFDAKPPKDATRPGGWGLSFDWTLLRGFEGGKPWFLAGGLTADNVAEAVQISGAKLVDVSSGVESAPGVKDPARISAFLHAVKSL